MTKRFPFPNPVNETSARIVAAGVVVISTLFLLTNSTTKPPGITTATLAPKNGTMANLNAATITVTTPQKD